MVIIIIIIIIIITVPYFAFVRNSVLAEVMYPFILSDMIQKFVVIVSL
jgi:hypothetical protein